MAAWSYYENNNYDAAVLSAERFIKNHPTHELIPYAFYLRAMSFYERIIDVERDAKMTVLAKEAFSVLIEKFPNSEYSREARLKIELTRSNLAGKHMAIGRFYQSQKKFSSAIRRFKIVIKEYETTDQTPEALLRLTECYLSLGLTDEAQKTASVLIYNFPKSIWTKSIPSYFKLNNTEPKIEQESDGFFSSLKFIF